MLRACKTCGQPVASTAGKCPHCGQRDPTGAEGKAVAYGCGGCLVVIVIIFLASAIMKPLSQHRAVTQAAVADSLASVAAAVDSVRIDSLLSHTSTAEIRRLPTQDLRLIASRPATGKDSARVVAARRVLQRLDRRAAIDARVSYARQVEVKFLSEGRDLRASLEGRDSTVLRLRYVLLGRPDAFQLQTNSDVMGQLGRLGFRKVILTDGYSETYTVTVPSPLVP